MMNFSQSIQQQLTQFMPYFDRKVFIGLNIFSQQQERVAFFIREIEITAKTLEQAEQTELAEFYAEKLLVQFKLLQTAIEKLKKQPKITATAQFQSKYHFPKNIHHLPEERKVIEYKKALKALDEKMNWLTEQFYQAEGENKISLQNEIQVTEYRRNKCLQAINELV